MIDLTKLREESATLFTKATATIEKATTDGRELTADEKTETDAQFARLKVIKEIEENNAKLAGYAFASGKAIKPAEPAGREEAAQIEGGAMKFDAKKPEQLAQFSKAANEWARTGNMPQQFATITTATQNGILMPSDVVAPISPTAVNSFRAAHDYYKVPPLKTANTQTLTIPVLDPNAGGVVSETASTDTDAPPSLAESMIIACKMYQSGSAWFSNLELSAVDFDLLGSTLPSLEYTKELGLESAMTAAIIADTNITLSVTSTGLTTIKYGDLVALNRALPKRFDQQKCIVLSTSAFIAVEAMVDSNGRPILTNDPQNVGLKLFAGTPIIRSDYFAPTGTAANVIGVCFSLMGFRLRDAGGEQIARYANVPTRPAQTGLNLFSAHGWGYAPTAIAKFVNHA